MGLLTGALAERVSRSHVNRRSAAQIGQAEIGLPVAAIRCAEQREQGLILIDRQKLPIAHRPASRCKAEAHQTDFGEEGLGHFFYSRFSEEAIKEDCRQES